MTALDLQYPKGWGELDQKELLALLRCIVSTQRYTQYAAYFDEDDYNTQTWAIIATMRLFRYNGVKVVSPYGNGYLIKHNKQEYYISCEQIAAVLDKVKWIREIPKEPVRLDKVGKYNALPPDISGLQFGKWLEVENLWQGYNATRDDQLLRSIGEILYPGIKGKKFSDAELLGVFYWIAAVKEMLAQRFGNFFKPFGDESGGEPISFDALRRAADAQIRALTKGDVTKEDQIYETDLYRALTELDAQAKEYDEITKKYGKN